MTAMYQNFPPLNFTHYDLTLPIMVANDGKTGTCQESIDLCADDFSK